MHITNHFLLFVALILVALTRSTSRWLWLLYWIPVLLLAGSISFPYLSCSACISFLQLAYNIIGLAKSQRTTMTLHCASSRLLGSNSVSASPTMSSCAYHVHISFDAEVFWSPWRNKVLVLSLFSPHDSDDHGHSWAGEVCLSRFGNWSWDVLGPVKVLGNQLPWRIWSSLVMRRTCSGVDEPELSELAIHSDHSESEFFPCDMQGRACIFLIFLCALTRPLSNWRKYLTKQRQWSRKALRTHHSWAHGKATDVRSTVQHRMRSPVKRLRSNGDRGTSVVRPFSALVAWRWAQISITLHCTEDVRCHTTVTTCYYYMLHHVTTYIYN